MFANIDMNDDTTAMLIILPPVILFFVALLVGLVLVIRDTVRRKGGFGINTRRAFCPCCGDPAPLARVPRNWRQALWGGCTCTNCGLEYDKWGRAVHATDLERRRDELDNNPYARPWPRGTEAADLVTPPDQMT